MLFEKERTREYWLTMRENPDFADRLNQVKAAYEAISGPGELTYTLKNIYYRTGSRDEYEEPHLVRRDLMHSAGILALAYPEEQKYLDSFHDAVWAICQEESWILPAHGKMLFEGNNIDLVSALTGGAMAELLWFLGDRVDEAVRIAAARELRRQIIEPYKNNIIHWESARHNWGAVCGCGVGAVLMYQDPAEFLRQQDRLIATMDCVLSSYPEDGSCLEGIGYWEYGFGHFVAFAHMLKQFSDGTIDLLKRPVVEAAASYGPKQYLVGDCTVSYADGERDKHIYSGLAEYLYSIFPNSVPKLPRERKNYGVVRHWFTFRMEFLAFVPDASGPIEQHDYYLKSGGQIILNRPNYSFAVKAGHNAEPHNHNDVGSFIVSDRTGQILCDIGVGCYNTTYFLADTRYTVLCNSSRGHSVPIIDGCYQKEGHEYCGKMTVCENGCDIDMTKAYGMSNMTGINRSISWKENEIAISDTYKGSWNNITERLVSLVEPRIDGNIICFGENVTVSFGDWADGVNISSEMHRRRAPVGVMDKVYLIDLPVKKGISQSQYIIRIKE